MTVTVTSRKGGKPARAPKAAAKPHPNSTFDAKIAAELCERIMEGRTLTSVCRDEDMPARSTAHLWMQTHKEFAVQVEEARKIQREVWKDEILDIADNVEVGTKTVTRDKHIEKTVADMTQHRALRIEARQWLLEKCSPEACGPRIRLEHSGPDGKPIEFNDVSLTDAERLAAVAAIFDSARTRHAGQGPGAAEDLGAAEGPADGGVQQPG